MRSDVQCDQKFREKGTDVGAIMVMVAYKSCERILKVARVH